MAVTVCRLKPRRVARLPTLARCQLAQCQHWGPPNRYWTANCGLDFGSTASTGVLSLSPTMSALSTRVLESITIGFKSAQAARMPES